MGITGRYNFPGIQKLARAGINLLLAGTAWGAWILASPFKPLVDQLEDLIDNWLANHGLIILNIGANIIDGVVDQAALDDAMDAGIKRVMQGRDKITPEEGKAIDDRVRKAFDEDADLGAALGPDGSVQVFSSASLRAGDNAALQPELSVQERDDQGDLRATPAGLPGQKEPLTDPDNGSVENNPNGHSEQLRVPAVRTVDWKDRRNLFRT